MIQPGQIAEVMGGRAILGHQIRSIEDLDRMVARGLPKRALRRAAERVYPAPGEARRAVFRIVPEATFKRRTRLSIAESERTERLARTIAAAEWVWGDPEAARAWLRTPHAGLGGQTPLDLAASELGARRVEDLLERLYYGVPL